MGENWDFKGTGLPTMVAVDDTAGVEMKYEEKSCWSSHPHIWFVGGACNEAWLQIFKSEWREREREKQIWKKKEKKN